jgi:aminoglycoside 3-N-acetyltransferase
MWTEAQIREDLLDLGVREGITLLAHTSLRAIGKIEGGAETLYHVLRSLIGSEGTLLVPTFSPRRKDPAEASAIPLSAEEITAMREAVPVFDREEPANIALVGVFPEFVRQLPDAVRSLHPTLSFTAVGANADYLTRNAPFHYPLGADSPLARLHQLDGHVLLIGVNQTRNAILHLAEVWANTPYIHRSVMLKTGEGEWTAMQGSPECSAGFRKIEPVLRQARLLKESYVGNAVCQMMRVRQVVSMAVSMMQGDGGALLCDDESCPWCRVGHKYTQPQSMF